MKAFALQKYHPSLEDLDYSLPCPFLAMVYTLHKMHFEQKVFHYVPQTLVLISLILVVYQADPLPSQFLPLGVLIM